ncbi:MAG TPA: DUF4390 domain-containing protein [Ramlibacter sp.]|uniref:DUF4390 domain-containing protein n=1 Tax=Ramlibacter sp. TaxID=1917967 RepID=UPI002D8098FF|nr:DUF4390 domain-containing protein [Ramlibacter sp.]HET8746138.1 DUF4390 domain-containing protein [Ramlibacter sp.]
MHRRPARRPERALFVAVGLCALALVLALAGGRDASAQIHMAEVTQLEVERTEDDVLLSAAVRFELPQVVDDALAKGIPMYFLAEAAIYRDRWYWYDKRVAFATRHMRLSYQPLTRRWRLQVSSAPIGNAGLVLGQNFDTRDEALAALQRISGWRIARASAVDPDSVHTIDFRFRLDVSQLPRPFQIGAVGQADWIILAVRNQRLQLDSK